MSDCCNLPKYHDVTGHFQSSLHEVGHLGGLKTFVTDGVGGDLRRFLGAGRAESRVFGRMAGSGLGGVGHGGGFELGVVFVMTDGNGVFDGRA